MAVYTHVTKEELILFLKRYQIGQLKSFEEISEGVETWGISKWSLYCGFGAF